MYRYPPVRMKFIITEYRVVLDDIHGGQDKGHIKG